MEDRKDKRYFAICRNDGGIEWFELYEDTGEIENEDYEYRGRETRMNYLKADGTIRYSNRFVKSKKKTYLDIICPKCEAPMTLIPFSMVEDKAERIRVFQMEPEDRIRFAEKYLMLEGFEDDDEDKTLQ